MNLRSITTLGIISLITASTSYLPAEANSMQQYLNMVAVQNMMNQQAAAAAAAAAQPVVPPAQAPAPVAYNYDYYNKSQIDAQRTALVKRIYNLNYSLLHDSLSPRAYARTQAKVADLQAKLTRLNALGT
ncbi:MAG: hypothetical protein KIT34_16620 [Cyanobacteria bacterium TGS_CYA1]|nr:hypothetical protein [Cyanobacteria bacterium TGS_CYA1]